MSITFHQTDRPRRKWVQLQCEGCGFTFVCETFRDALDAMRDNNWFETYEESVFARDDEQPYYTEHFCCEDCLDPPEWNQ